METKTVSEYGDIYHAVDHGDTWPQEIQDTEFIDKSIRHPRQGSGQEVHHCNYISNFYALAA